ncbi:MAG: HD domain-containing protein [Hyphomicrobiaceae bacterium]|nr:HD domain-containing protein [Hyphomicrobiaceae bacterium]
MANTLLLTIRALRFAAEAHVDQRRKGNRGEPYINHLIEVAHLVAEATEGEDTTAIAAALLHDSVEDTAVTHTDLATSFGEEIASIVDEVTDDKTMKFAERKALQVERAPNLSPRAKIIKLADKTSNVRSLVQSPPDWPPDRLRDYVDWSIKVIEGCRGASPYLEARFDEAVAAFRDAYR